MEKKKKYTVLSIQQRLDVLKEAQESSLTVSDLGKKFGVGVRTIMRIKQNAEKINSFADKSKREKKRRKLIDPVYDQLDKDLLSWVSQRRKLGDPLTDALILDKARELKDSMPSCSRFKASYGWLSQFKKRHGIRLLKVNNKECTEDEDNAQSFIHSFELMILEENISSNNIYCMDECGLIWKSLPSKTIARQKEAAFSQVKRRKDRITIGLCANASGTHKITPLVIYRYKKPRALKHESSLPVILKSQATASMDSVIFLDWFENHFKPSVREYQDQHRLTGKVLLLVEKSEEHKVSGELQNDGNFKIIYFPSNTISIVQPMRQGVIVETKRLFRHKLLQRVLSYQNRMVGFQKDYTLKMCIDMLSQSWSEITAENIRNAWINIMGTVTNLSKAAPDQLASDWQDMLGVVKTEDCGIDDVINYFSECESAERGNEDQSSEEDIVIKDEPLDEVDRLSQTQKSHVNNGDDKTELRDILDRLLAHSHKAPPYIQCVVQGLQLFFLGND